MRHKNTILVNWCCMSKVIGESVDYLFLHFSMARELWDTVFSLFGIHWVMSRRVVDFFACLQGRMGCHQNSVIWSAFPHCLMWCL